MQKLSINAKIAYIQRNRCEKTVQKKKVYFDISWSSQRSTAPKSKINQVSYEKTENQSIQKSLQKSTVSNRIKLVT